MTQPQQQREKLGSVHYAMDKLQDLLGGLLGRVAAKTVTTADAFVENAAIGDMYQLQAAGIALQRSKSPQVKDFARKMIADHTTSKHQLKAALEMNETKGVKAPPTELDTRRRKMIENLNSAPPEKFDQMYLDQQVMACEETLTLMTKYYDDGDNPQLRSCAAGTAPVVYRHLQQVKELKAKLPS